MGTIKKDYDYNDGQNYEAVTKETDALIICLLVESFKEAKGLFAVSVKDPVKTTERASGDYKKAFMDYLPTQRDRLLEESEKLLEGGDFSIISGGYNQSYQDIYDVYKKREKMRFCKYKRSKKKTGTSCSATLDLCFFEKSKVAFKNNPNNGATWTEYGYLGAFKLVVDMDDDLNISNSRIELSEITSYTDLWTGAFTVEFKLNKQES